MMTEVHGLLYMMTVFLANAYLFAKFSPIAWAYIEIMSKISQASWHELLVFAQT